MKYPKRLKTFERDDRDHLSGVINGLGDIITFAETLQLIEEYGLSIRATEKEESIS